MTKARTPSDATPRERVVYQTVQLIRQDGVTGTSLRNAVAAAGAPWGSMQFYFPGGKDQLVEEALTWAAGYAAARVERYVQTAKRPSPSGLFAWMARQWRDEFKTRGFDRGCPLVAGTADVAAANEALRESISRAFDTWQRPVAAALRSMGVPSARSQSLAVLMLSSLEGAIVLARARHETGPLTTVVRELGPVLDGAVPL